VATPWKRKDARAARIRPDYSAREHARAALLSAEFQRSIIQLIDNTYPEKRRLIHVHIQKTAGLGLQEKLFAQFPTALSSLSQEELSVKRVFFEAGDRPFAVIRHTYDIVVYTSILSYRLLHRSILRMGSLSAGLGDTRSLLQEMPRSSKAGRS
jgi:hypothetical protein